jgi:antitoxin component YwqK of YwqJK toxin-antitoxin module
MAEQAGPSGPESETAAETPDPAPPAPLEGELVTLDAGSGEPVERVGYRAGQPHGEAITYRAGRIAERMLFRRGLLHGVVTSHDEEGRVVQEAEYRDGRLHGQVVIRDQEGRPAQRMTYRDGRLDGTLEQFDDGLLACTVSYRDGRADGPMTLYDTETGSVIGIIPYRTGKRHGEARFFDRDGVLQRTARYADDRLEGESVDFYPNGEVARVVTYRGARLEGESRAFYPDGALMEEARYRAGKLEDHVRRYDPAGRRLETEEEEAEPGRSVLQRWLGRG